MTPNRFKLARELTGFTQTELARLITAASARHVAQSTIAEIETGRLVPSTDLAMAIGEVTQLPLEFFEQADLPEFPSGSLLMFRAKSVVTAREEAQVRAHARLVAEIVDRIARRIDLLPCLIPQLSDSPPVEAARLTRSALGMSPDLPIDNLIRTIERAGVVVLALPIARDPVDAFSTWVGQREHLPFMAVLRDAPADRLRWSVAHELGHLVLHRAMTGGAALMEDDANRFAAEFLTPRAAMEQEITTPVTLVSLRDLKARWRVSMRSLVNRAHETGVINARQRTYLFMKLNKTFGGKSESALFLPERPRALLQLFEMTYGLPIDFAAAADDLRLTPERLMDILGNYKGGTPSPTGDALPASNVVKFTRRGA